MTILPLVFDFKSDKKSYQTTPSQELIFKRGTPLQLAFPFLGKSFHQEAVKSLLICFLAASFSFHQELEKMRKKSSYWKIKLYFGFAYLASQGEYRVTYFEKSLKYKTEILFNCQTKSTAALGTTFGLLLLLLLLLSVISN